MAIERMRRKQVNFPEPTPAPRMRHSIQASVTFETWKRRAYTGKWEHLNLRFQPTANTRLESSLHAINCSGR